MTVVRKSTISGRKTGTSTAAYVEALRVDTRGYGVLGKTRLLIRNESGTQTIFYKIDGYLCENASLALALKAETSIAVSTTIDSTTDVIQGYAALVVSIKQNSGAGAYTIEWTTL